MISFVNSADQQLNVYFNRAHVPDGEVAILLESVNNGSLAELFTQRAPRLDMPLNETVGAGKPYNSMHTKTQPFVVTYKLLVIDNGNGSRYPYQDSFQSRLHDILSFFADGVKGAVHGVNGGSAVAFTNGNTFFTFNGVLADVPEVELGSNNKTARVTLIIQYSEPFAMRYTSTPVVVAAGNTGTLTERCCVVLQVAPNTTITRVTNGTLTRFLCIPNTAIPDLTGYNMAIMGASGIYKLGMSGGAVSIDIVSCGATGSPVIPAGTVGVRSESVSPVKFFPVHT